MSASRRAFLGSSLFGLATSQVCGADALPNRSFEEAAFQPNTLFLTWQRDPTTTMTIQWIGVQGETADTKIYYSPTTTALLPGWEVQPTTAKPYPMTDYKVFRAELSGLTPDTDYSFQIGKASPIYRFRTMPAKATDAISFISGGDCGINSHAIANNIQAARQDPMFAVVGGDLGYDNGKSVDVSLAFIRNYSKTMIGRNGRLIPLLACLGNHEVEGGYAKVRERAPFFFALFDGLFRDTSFATLDFGNYLSLMLLDSGHISPISGDQTSWLEKQLSERVDHPHVMAVNHVPAYPSHRKYIEENGKPGTGAENRQHWVPLFEKYRVPVVLEHHDHTFKRTKPLLNGLAHDNGVLYLGDGSWGRIRAPMKPDKLPFLATSSESYHLSLHRIEGEQRFHLALDENGRVMDVCRTGQRTKA
jgi:purple acid phosphatase-like protein/calcineurin-like phosphoesterase family protein